MPFSWPRLRRLCVRSPALFRRRVPRPVQRVIRYYVLTQCAPQLPARAILGERLRVSGPHSQPTSQTRTAPNKPPDGCEVSRRRCEKNNHAHPLRAITWSRDQRYRCSASSVAGTVGAVGAVGASLGWELGDVRQRSCARSSASVLRNRIPRLGLSSPSYGIESEGSGVECLMMTWSGSCERPRGTPLPPPTVPGGMAWPKIWRNLCLLRAHNSQARSGGAAGVRQTTTRGGGGGRVLVRKWSFFWGLARAGSKGVPGGKHGFELLGLALSHRSRRPSRPTGDRVRPRQVAVGNLQPTTSRSSHRS